MVAPRICYFYIYTAPPPNWKSFFCLFMSVCCANFSTIKKTSSKNLNVCVILVLDVTFVPNLTFLGLLSPEISFGEKTYTQTPTHPDTQCISPSVNLSEEDKKSKPQAGPQSIQPCLHIKATKQTDWETPWSSTAIVDISCIWCGLTISSTCTKLND